MALLSIAFLERQIALKQWLGILTIVLGLFIVGIADLLFKSDKKPDTNGVISGNQAFCTLLYYLICTIVGRE